MIYCVQNAPPLSHYFCLIFISEQTQYTKTRHYCEINQRVLGTSLPGYWSGSFKKDGEESFFNIRRENKPVVIQLKNEKYTRLILGVDDPENVVDLINNNIK